MDTDKSDEQDGGAHVEVDHTEDGRSIFNKTDPNPSPTQKKMQQRMMMEEEGGTIRVGRTCPIQPTRSAHPDLDDFCVYFAGSG